MNSATMADDFTAASPLFVGGVDRTVCSATTGAAVCYTASVVGGGMDDEDRLGSEGVWGDGEIFAGSEAIGQLVDALI